MRRQPLRRHRARLEQPPRPAPKAAVSPGNTRARTTNASDSGTVTARPHPSVPTTSTANIRRAAARPKAEVLTGCAMRYSTIGVAARCGRLNGTDLAREFPREQNRHACGNPRVGAARSAPHQKAPTGFDAIRVELDAAWKRQNDQVAIEQGLRQAFEVDARRACEFCFGVIVNGSAAIRPVGAAVLARYADAPSLAATARALNRVDYRDERRLFVRMLGRHAKVDGVYELAAGFLEDQDMMVRASAITALAPRRESRRRSASSCARLTFRPRIRRATAAGSATSSTWPRTARCTP